MPRTWVRCMECRVVFIAPTVDPDLIRKVNRCGYCSGGPLTVLLSLDGRRNRPAPAGVRQAPGAGRHAPQPQGRVD